MATKRTHPKNFERLQACKACGISAREAWQAIRAGVRESGMIPSAAAITLSTAWDYLIELYGVEATRGLRP